MDSAIRPGRQTEQASAALLARCSALAALAAVFLVAGAGCGDSQPESAQSAPAQIEPAEVTAEERSFIDTTRATPANREFEGAPERTLETRLWYAPTQLNSDACSSKGCGLLVLAHGFGGNTGRFDIFARELASRGWIVVAPSFPLTNDRGPGGFGSAIGDLIEQPGDLSFLIDQLFAAFGESGDVLHGRVDAGRIGLVGHSLGGATVIALDRHDCCWDKRVGATFLVAPTVFLLPIFGDATDPVGAPILLLAGTEDFAVAPEIVADFFAVLGGFKIFALLQGYDHVTHLEAGEPAPFPERIAGTARLADAFFRETLAGGSDLDEHLGQLRRDGHEVATGS
ncbi:MAG: alpha/beta fold hydrolase [bacterium]